MRSILAVLAFLIIKLLNALLRYRIIDRHHSLMAIDREETILFSFFHGDQLMLFGYPSPRPLVQMSSLSKDGELQSEILRLLGYQVVRGSSGSGGREALHEMNNMVISGCHGALAVDGSRGPLHKVKSGILRLARDSGAIIIPLAASCRYSTILDKSWDRYEIPWPLSSCIIVEGEPMEVDQDIDDDGLQELRIELEERMLDLKSMAEQLSGKRKESVSDGME